MKLTLRSRGVELTEELRVHVMRSVRFSLARLLTAESRVTVALADVNGPRGGLDKRVLVRIAAPGVAQVVIQEHGHTVGAAVDRAVDRAARSVARARDRARFSSGSARPSRSPLSSAP